MPGVTVVCAGSIGAGKTTLLNILKSKKQSNAKANDDEKGDENTNDLGLPKTSTPTVGINHFQIPVHRPASYLVNKNKKDRLVDHCFPFLTGGTSSDSKPSVDVNVRELGGGLAPLWLTYAKSFFDPYNKNGLLFVIDPSNKGQLCSAGLHLIELIQFYEDQKEAAQVKVLIAFSKLDTFETGREKLLSEATAILRLDYLRAWCKNCVVSSVSFSSETEEGIDNIVDWLASICQEVQH